MERGVECVAKPGFARSTEGLGFALGTGQGRVDLLYEHERPEGNVEG